MDADDPKRLVEIEQMLAAATEAWRAGRAEEAAGLYRAIIAKGAKAIALLEKDAGDDPDALIGLGNAYVVSGRIGDTQGGTRLA